MNIEEYLQNNKDKLTHHADSDKIWGSVYRKLQHKESKNANKMAIFLVLCLLLLFGLFIFTRMQQNKEIKDTKKELFALKNSINNLIQTGKTSSRLKAVNMSSEAVNADYEIISILIDRMRNDRSPNVQLAATRALEKHMNTDDVRIAMIETLSKAEDTYLQLKLIDLLSQHKEKRLLPYLDSIIRSNEAKSIITAPAKRAGKILKEL